MNLPSSPLWTWSATDLALGIRSRALSSREAVRAVLDRTAAVNGRLNAVVEVLEEEALATADAADVAVARGDALGPLHGVPVTTKINIDQKGVATSNGIVALKDMIATEDSPVVTNLRHAGAVIFGRTNTPAFSFRWFTDNALHGRTLNPWSQAHTPGGSSGGASSAVAAGLGPIAHGNDIAGSVRYPAYCTGVIGLRPSFGRVPAFNASSAEERPPGMQLMSVQGPLARTVADVRTSLAVMARGDARDPWWVPAPLQGEPAARPIRVAVSRSIPGVKMHPAVLTAIDTAAGWLAQAGYRVEEAEPPALEEAARLWQHIVDNEARLAMGPLVERMGDEGIRKAFGYMIRKTPALETEAYFRALARRTALIRQWNAFLSTYPILLGPLSAEPPFPWGLDTESPEGMDRIIAAQAPQFAIPLLGLPGLCVPAGGAHDGGVRLPVGVQLVAARFREDLLLDAAEVIEARYPCTTPIDPVWS